MNALLVTRVSMVIGYDDQGRSTELNILASPTQTIFVKPGEAVIVATTHPSGEQSITEYFPGMFYAWNYVPKLPPEVQEPDAKEEGRPQVDATD